MPTTQHSRSIKPVLSYLVHMGAAALLACVALGILPDFRAGLEPGVPLPVLTSVAIWHGGVLSVLPVGAACILGLLDALAVRAVRENREWTYSLLYVVAIGTAIVLLVGVAAPYCALSFPEAQSIREAAPVPPGPSQLASSNATVRQGQRHGRPSSVSTAPTETPNGRAWPPAHGGTRRRVHPSGFGGPGCVVGLTFGHAKGGPLCRLLL
jgi:hypothetical protein